MYKNQTSQNVNTTSAILSYCTVLGFIIALIMNNNKTGEEKSFGAYHLRQALGLFVVWVGLAIIVSLLIRITLSFDFLEPTLSLVVLAFAIIGIVNAYNRHRKPLPIFGNYIENKYGHLFE